MLKALTVERICPACEHDEAVHNPRRPRDAVRAGCNWSGDGRRPASWNGDDGSWPLPVSAELGRSQDGRQELLHRDVHGGRGRTVNTRRNDAAARAGSTIPGRPGLSWPPRRNRHTPTPTRLRFRTFFIRNSGEQS